MDDFKYYSEKLDNYKCQYQEALNEGNVARINCLVRDASFVCTKLFKNVVVELSSMTKEPQNNQALHQFSLSEAEIKKDQVFIAKVLSNTCSEKLCLNDCGNIAPEDKDCCSPKCREQFKVKKYRQKKREEKILTA